MRKTFTKLMMICFVAVAFINASAEDKVPITIFDFGEGDGGWVVREFSTLRSGPVTDWVWTNSAYRNLTAGHWRSFSSGTQYKRNALVYSPVLDLANKAEVEMYLTLAQSWSGDGNNLNYCYVQDVDSVDITELDDSTLIKQWNKSWTLNCDIANFVEMGLPSKPADHSLFTAGPLNLAKFDGKKIRIAFHMWNVTNGEGNVNYRVYGVKNVTVAALTDDTASPVGSVEEIDSVGNTFMRPYYKADEICKVSWAVVPKGSSIADFDDLVNNIGTDKFVSSGTFSYNIPGIDKSFFVEGLTIDTDYTLFYVAEDYKGNKTALGSIDQKTISDLTAPVVTNVSMVEIGSISGSVNIASDEAGIIRYRVYEAGLEPADFDQFNAGTGSVIQQDIAIETDSTILLEGLTLSTSYIVYAVVTDMTGNISAIKKSDVFTTLADEKAPVITNMVIEGITNHEATLKLTADEPTAGFGNVTCYWSATAPDVELTAEEVMNRTNSFASGSTSDLDSATFESSLAINNLNINTEYKLHVVLVDFSENVSDVSTLTFTTTNEIERVLAFGNDFNVEGQNYHFIEVVKQEGAADHWRSLPNDERDGDVGSVYVTRTNLEGKGEEAWCIIGPMDLRNLTDISFSTDIFKGYGGDGRNSLSMFISKSYKPEDGLDQNLWSEIMSVGEMTFAQKVLVHLEKDLSPDLKMDTAGVYMAIRFNHNSWALNYNIYNLKVYGTLSSKPEPPIIDWVEASNPSATSATVSFTASSYGRMFYYILKDDGEGVTGPSLEQAKAGEGADVFGYKDYTAGNYIDQKFNVGGLEPSSKYHVYTTFRSNLFAWADEVFYDDEVCVFTTANLEMTSCDTSMVYATSAKIKTASEAAGRIYYTIKPAGATAPESLEDIRNSFDKKGNVNYNITDGTAMEWEITNLVPFTDYELYVSIADNDGIYGSEITKIAFTTNDLKVNSLQAEDALLLPDTALYNVSIKASVSDMGTLYMMMTAADAAQPTADQIMSGEGAIRSASADVVDPNEVILVLDSLTEAESASYEAWFVLKSGNRLSKIAALNTVVEYTYSAKFKVADTDGTPLQGINIKIGDMNLVTGSNGVATLSELKAGSYDYEMSRSDLSATVTGTVVIVDKNETVEVVYDVHLALDGAESNTIKLYPNPATTEVNFNLNFAAQVKIVDLSGKVISNNNYQKGINRISTAGMESGIYLMSFQGTDGQSTTMKLVVK